MPNEAVPFHSELVNTASGHDLVVTKSYEAPLDAKGDPIEDKFAAMDMANAEWMFNVLNREYPGHAWRCRHDGRQGMAYLSIPILMGINKFWAINLKTDPLSRDLLVRAGGEILERYGLSRTRFNLGEFLEARAKHSLLNRPWGKIPG